jgi:hypothetical protein
VRRGIEKKDGRISTRRAYSVSDPRAYRVYDEVPEVGADGRGGGAGKGFDAGHLCAARGEDIEEARSEGARAFVFVDPAASDDQPVAGTGLTARYKGHRLTGGSFHSRPALCLAAALFHETAKCPESCDLRDDPSSRLTVGSVYFICFFLHAASDIL